MNKENNILVFDKEITLTGIYKEAVLSKRAETPHQGHYKIVINDTTEIILLAPYLKEAIRDAEEVQQFNNKQVIITGIVESETYMEEPSFDYEVLTVDIPCFSSITSIRLAP